MGRLCDLATTGSSCRRGKGNTLWAGRVEQDYKGLIGQTKGGWILIFSIFYDNLEQGLYRPGGSCYEIYHDLTQSTSRGNVIKKKELNRKVLQNQNNGCWVDKSGKL